MENLNVSSAIIETATETPSFKRTLDNVFYKFTHKINFSIEKLRIEDDVYLQEYRKNLETKYTDIPEANRIPPRRCITERALDESIYYIEEPELRELFEDLIISSVDERCISENHPAFIDIIKQLSPLDAQNLKLFKNQITLAIVDYIYDFSGSHYLVFHPDVFLENPKQQDIFLQSVSIRNLTRLGLVDIPEKQFSHLSDKSVYDKYKRTPLFLQELEKMKKGELAAGVTNVSTVNGYVELTPFGKSFIDICCRPLA